MTDIPDQPDVSIDLGLLRYIEFHGLDYCVTIYPNVIDAMERAARFAAETADGMPVATRSWMRPDLMTD